MSTHLSPEQWPGHTESVTMTSPKSVPDVTKDKSKSGRSTPKPLPTVLRAIPLLAEVLIVAVGSLVLWWGADGNGVINANQTSITVFIASLTALMTGRGFILVMLDAPMATPKSSPFRTQWLTTVRNVALVVVALYSKYLGDYMGQWIITFAAIALAATSATGLILAIIRREPSTLLTHRCLDACAGFLALVFTYDIHHWDATFISALTSLVLVPAFFAWAITKTVSTD
ncbi:hypothetical protein ACFRJ9_19585 [Paenarthrobacter sp. NPDC056912]|uniref:hypothetical protein n=1 Tax=Paenarthrobacter sp. NPDC056912 TaxID=3345965 RepID=UPI00366A77A1